MAHSCQPCHLDRAGSEVEDEEAGGKRERAGPRRPEDKANVIALLDEADRHADELGA